jgi:hypothetical protein
MVCFSRSSLELYAILHIPHTYVPPLNPVGLLGLVDGGILDSDILFTYVQSDLYVTKAIFSTSFIIPSWVSQFVYYNIHKYYI